MFRVLVDFAHSYLSMHELLTAGSRLSGILDRGFSDSPFIGAQLPKLNQATDNLKQAFQRTAGSDYTEELAQFDRARDAAFRSLVGYLDGMAAVVVKPEISKPSAELLGIIEKHDRSMYRFGYARESAALSGLLSELSQDTAQSLLQQAGAIELTDALRDATKAFEDTYQAKIAEESTKNYPEAAAAAADIVYRLDALLMYADVLAVDEPKRYRTVAEELNQTITEIQAPARARATRGERLSEQVAG